jgi:hypothetical protein
MASTSSRFIFLQEKIEDEDEEEEEEEIEEEKKCLQECNTSVRRKKRKVYFMLFRTSYTHI